MASNLLKMQENIISELKSTFGEVLAEVKALATPSGIPIGVRGSVNIGNLKVSDIDDWLNWIGAEHGVEEGEGLKRSSKQGVLYFTYRI